MAQIRLDPHPARIKNRISGEKTLMFPDERQIMLVDGDSPAKRLGYCTMKPGFPINLIVKMTEPEQQAIRDYIEQELGDKCGPISNAGQLVAVESDDEE